MDTAERRAAVGLWSIQGVGAKGFAAFEAKVPRREWAALPMREVARRYTDKPALQAQLSRGPGLLARAEVVEAQLRRCGGRVCLSGDAAYPEALVGLEGAPPVLFFKGPGAAQAGRAQVAIVGTRAVPAEWWSWTFELARACARQGLVVVSGGAEGVDSAAHAGTLAAGGVTWAFAASGLDQLDDPPKRVLAALDARSTMFTALPPGVRANDGLFVQRNRLISGAAKAVVVVRGKEGSGARHTAQYALEQRRPLLAVPPGPMEPDAGLCRTLLRQGCAPCFDVSDVMRALSVEATTMADEVFERSAIDAGSQALWARLPAGPFTMERALEALPELGSGDVTALLVELELAGWVVPRSGRRYEKRA